MRWKKKLGIEARDVDDEIAITEAFLAPLVPPSSPRLLRLRDLVERMASDRSGPLRSPNA
ncbi:MAG: hypothetical protein ACMG6S_24445 [Byssovorax sp.]